MKKYHKLVVIMLSLIMVLECFGIDSAKADSDSTYGGRDYSLVFNADYYYNSYADLRSAIGYNKSALLSHFVNNGMKEGRQGCENFRVSYYKSKYGDLQRAFGNNLKLYYEHYIDCGYKEGRAGNSITYYKGYEYSSVFNAKFYYNKYTDLQKAFGYNEKALFSHFINYGIKEGRQGCWQFSVTLYKSRYGDLRKAFGDNNASYILHYLTSGIKENRNATPDYYYNGVDYSLVYDKDYYYNSYPDLQRAFGNNARLLIQHFVNCGMNEGRQGCASFNPYYYKNLYADLAKAYGNTMKSYYIHYMNFGNRERRQGSETPRNGWANLEGGKVYFIEAVKATGWQRINGRSYYFDENGYLKTKTGIDVSSYNEVIDWERVKNDGVEFAIIRIGYGGDYEDQDDTMAITNMKMCEKYGIPYGVYLYSYALTSENVESEIKHTLRMIEGMNPTLGVYFDMEDADGYKQRKGMPSQEQLNQFCLRFMEAMKDAGYATGTYASKYWFDTILTDTKLDNYPIWLAQWYTRPTSTKNFLIWQYTSEGRVDGINGNVDMNAMFVE